MIRTRGLTKRYGGTPVVDGVSLDVPEGERYGFLGPNGSGKTTTVRMLLGLVFATSGEIELLGRPVPSDAAAALADVGSLVEAPAAYGHLSARANLALFDAAGPSDSRLPRLSRSQRRERIDEALELVGLGGVGRKPVRAYSLGMRQRLGLAAALVRRPRLLVLDEPTNGLDPQGILEIRELLLKLNSDGTTIFLSSHQLSEVEQLCTRVGVMDRGRLVSQVAMADVRRPTGRVHLRVGDADAALALLDGHVAERDGDRLLVAGSAVPELVRRLVGRDIEVHEATPERRSLESLVLELTGPGSDRVGSDRSGSARVGSARSLPDGAGSGPVGGERS
jgi:ABC-2 type transport system ATP-binding protein